MTLKGLKLIFFITVMVLLQALFFNNLRLFTYALPIIYMYPLFKASIKFSRWFIILLAAYAGLLLDIFMNTLGINMFAATLVAFFRRPLVLRFMEEDEVAEGQGIPSRTTMSLGGFVFYLFVSLCILVSVTLLAEAFSVYMFVHLIPYIVATTFFSLFVTLIFDYFNRSGR